MKGPTHAQLTAWNDQEDRRVTALIRRYGCFIQAVYGEKPAPPFAYTVGLFGLGHPELIVFGLDTESAGVTLNWFFGRVRAGLDLTRGRSPCRQGRTPVCWWRSSQTRDPRCTPRTAIISVRARSRYLPTSSPGTQMEGFPGSRAIRAHRGSSRDLVTTSSEARHLYACGQ